MPSGARRCNFAVSENVCVCGAGGGGKEGVEELARIPEPVA